MNRNFSHKDTQRGLRPQPKKMKPQITQITLINKKIRRKFLLQNYCYESVSSCRPKFSCQKNKKLTHCNTKGHEEKKICVICVICGFYFSFVSV